MKKKGNNKFLKILGKRVRHLREKERLSQSQLGYESGVHRDQIGRIERGVQSASIDNLRAICEALGIKLKELFDFELPGK